MSGVWGLGLRDSGSPMTSASSVWGQSSPLLQGHCWVRALFHSGPRTVVGLQDQEIIYTVSSQVPAPLGDCLAQIISSTSIC